MPCRTMIAAVALLAASPTFAQSEPAEQTSDELICKLVDCPAAKPGSGARVPGRLRGFNIAVKKPTGRADLRVSFVTGSAELTEAGRKAGTKFVEALKSPLLAGLRFRIEGHTDAVGSRSYNLDLSKQRAQSVVNFLVANGAKENRFTVVGFGFDKPLPGTSPTSAANRRVEVVRIK